MSYIEAKWVIIILCLLLCPMTMKMEGQNSENPLSSNGFLSYNASKAAMETAIETYKHSFGINLWYEAQVVTYANTGVFLSDRTRIIAFFTLSLFIISLIIVVALLD
nr:uncharacterized protein LOC122272801 [Parasteatoda tepidariorum]